MQPSAIVACWRRGETYVIRDVDSRQVTAAEGREIVAERYPIPRELRQARRSLNPGHPQLARRPAQPTKGAEVLRIDDKHGSISFAGTGYRVGNHYRGQTVGIRLVGDTLQVALDGNLLRTHRARHDKTKEFGALAQPNGKPRRVRL